MADAQPKGQKLTEEEKALTRAWMETYRQSHPDATLKEMRAVLDLPFKEKISEGTLRGLSARRTGGARGRANGGRRGAETGGRSGRGGRASARNRPLESMIGDLSDLRRRRDELDAQMEDLEGQIQDRLRQGLGAEHAGRILGGLYGGVAGGRGELVGRVAGGDGGQQETGG